MDFIEVSAKTGQNVSDCFQRAATIVVEDIEKKAVDVENVFNFLPEPRYQEGKHAE